MGRRGGGGDDIAEGSCFLCDYLVGLDAKGASKWFWLDCLWDMHR